MKKTFLLAITFFLSALAFAQKPVWGLRGGLNLAIWNSENKSLNDRLDPRTGIHLGIISHNHLTHKIAIQPELQYSSQGTKNNDGTHKYDYRMSYISLPVMFQYMFDNGFRVEAGPYVGLLVAAKDVYEDGTSQNSKDDYKTADAGLGIGLNYLDYSGFGIGGRYNFGLANISDRVADYKTYNRVLQLSVFYMFDHDHKRKSR
jgi:hypothetical protein